MFIDDKRELEVFLGGENEFTVSSSGFCPRGLEGRWGGVTEAYGRRGRGYRGQSFLPRRDNGPILDVTCRGPQRCTDLDTRTEEDVDTSRVGRVGMYRRK